MVFFPVDTYTFNLVDDESVTLERLRRRTELSGNFTSRRSDKSFIGKIEGNEFQLISAETGFGALCILRGEIEDKNGLLIISMNKAFRVFSSLFLILPVMSFVSEVFLKNTVFSLQFAAFFLLIAVLQFLMIRYFFIGLAFRFLSKRSLGTFRDVADIENIQKN